MFHQSPRKAIYLTKARQEACFRQDLMAVMTVVLKGALHSLLLISRTAMTDQELRLLMTKILSLEMVMNRRQPTVQCTQRKF